MGTSGSRSPTSEIGKLDTADKDVNQFETVSQFHLSPGAAPYGITFGPNNDIWFTESGLDLIGWISPTSHAFQEIPIAGSTGTDDSEGSTDAYTPYNLTSAGSGPCGITYVQQDGYFWLTEPGQNAIGFLDPTGTGSPSKLYSITSDSNTGPNGSKTSVTLATSATQQTLAKGGQITVIYTPPAGVSIAAGAPLNVSDSDFIFLLKATNITPG
jgi:streptogramin lyase